MRTNTGKYSICVFFFAVKNAVSPSFCALEGIKRRVVQCVCVCVCVLGMFRNTGFYRLFVFRMLNAFAV